MAHRLAPPWLALLMLGLLPACSTQKLLADNMAGLLEEVEVQYLDEPSFRYGREAGASLLKMTDGVIASSPRNRRLLELGCRLNAQFALGFAEAEDGDFARSLYARALDYGLRALGDEELRSALESSADAVRARLAGHGPEEAELLFWTGVAYGGWIDQSRDSVRAIADLPNAMAFMERVIELEPGFFHGGAWLFKGRYHGSRGTELGGDPEKARECIERSRALSEDRFLLARVWQARYVAVPAQDQELFDELLFGVLEEPEGLLPGEALLDAVARQRAEELLLAADDYFVEGP